MTEPSDARPWKAIARLVDAGDAAGLDDYLESLPLALERLDLDPALVSGPLLTTVTDMCGFFVVLQLATLVLPRLS